MKSISPELLATAPDDPRSAIARMRDQLAHRYFDTDHAIVVDVVDNELPGPPRSPGGPGGTHRSR